MKNEKIDDFIRNNIGLYWDSISNLANALEEKFGNVFTKNEWWEIARDGIDKYYS